VTRVVLIAVVLFLLAPLSAFGQVASRQDQRQAKKSFRTAQKLWKSGDWEQAEDYFKRAEEFHKFWKYPFTFAEHLYKRQRYKEAWWGMQRAARYGIPPSQHKRFNRINQRIELKLFEGHSLLELVVIPADATVRLQNRRWEPPFRRWVDRSSSVLIIEHPSYVPVRITWKHPRGDLVFKEVRLISAGDYGRISVSGKPDSAQVSVDGNPEGQLPGVLSRLLKPGSHQVEVTHPGHVSKESVVNVSAGQTAVLDVQLALQSTFFGRMVRSKKFWGWTAAGAGLLTTIVGAVMLSDAAALRDDAEALNLNHSDGYEDYKKAFLAKTADIDGLSTGGGTAVTLGVLLMGGGATLLVLDYMGGQSKSARLQRESPSWQIVPTVNGVYGVMRF
jgi:hypothetical protein